uniref:Uncharacterized protein n=1 Tax=Triticum urartu TaxID=4572 RepID=A0A8R7U1J9_TRIUA
VVSGLPEHAGARVADAGDCGEHLRRSGRALHPEKVVEDVDHAGEGLLSDGDVVEYDAGVVRRIGAQLAGLVGAAEGLRQSGRARACYLLDDDARDPFHERRADDYPNRRPRQRRGRPRQEQEQQHRHGDRTSSSSC